MLINFSAIKEELLYPVMVIVTPGPSISSMIYSSKHYSQNSSRILDYAETSPRVGLARGVATCVGCPCPRSTPRRRLGEYIRIFAVPPSPDSPECWYCYHHSFHIRLTVLPAHRSIRVIWHFFVLFTLIAGFLGSLANCCLAEAYCRFIGTTFTSLKLPLLV